MAAGNYAAACEKFSSSRKLDDGLGTTLNLGQCYEKLGRTASAWAEFRDAAARARQAGAREREQYARDRVAALEKKLSRLTLTAGKIEPDERISRDGVVVDRAVLGTPIPVDPGSHVVEAVAHRQEEVVGGHRRAASFADGRGHPRSRSRARGGYRAW